MEFSAGALRVKLPAPSGLSRDTTGIYVNDGIAGAGLTITSKVLAVGAGTGITVAADSVAVNQAFSPTWTGTHQFNVDPQINANLDFIGANRSITNSGSFNLTMAPGGDLILDPTGNVQLPDAQELRTTNYSDSPSGITGLRMWDRGSNYRQLTMGAIKVDELFARVFVADETRIDRGEEYWSKSYGYVETDFVTPADEATVDVWFEDAPALATADLFSVNDSLMFQTIDWGTGIVIQRTWYQVVLKVSADATNKRQSWRIRRKVGGTTGYVIKKGSLAVDFGQLNQGRIYLSGLDQAGGPFIKMGQQTAAITTTAAPVFTDYVAMGNLNGVGGIAVDTWGFAAAKNLGTAIGSGFEGIVIDPTNGLRLFNVDMKMYDGGTLRSIYNNSDGINFLQDTTLDVLSNPEQYVTWYTGLNPLGTNVASIGAQGSSGSTNQLKLNVPSVTAKNGQISLAAQAPGGTVASIVASATAAGAADITLNANDGAGTPGSVLVYGILEMVGLDHARMIKIRAMNSSGLILEDDGANQGIKVKDGGTLELAQIDSDLQLAEAAVFKHGFNERYIAQGVVAAAGVKIARIAIASNYRSAFVRVMYVERVSSGTNRRVANCTFAILRQGSASQIYVSAIEIAGANRRIRAAADTTNGYINFFLTDTSDVDVAAGTYNTIMVELVACTSGASSTGMTVTIG